MYIYILFYMFYMIIIIFNCEKTSYIKFIILTNSKYEVK